MMETYDPLQALVDKVVVKLTRLPLDKVKNAVQNEILNKRTDSPDVVFTSHCKLPQECRGTCVTVNEAKLSSLGNDCNFDDLDLVNYSKVETFCVNGSTSMLSQAVADLPEDSKDWPLSVDRCVLQYHKVQIFLNRSRCFATLLPHVLSQGHEYGRRCTGGQQLGLTRESLPEGRGNLSLRQLRLQYVDALLRNILDASGCRVLGQEGDCPDGAVHVHLATTSSKQPKSDRRRMLVVGKVKARLNNRRMEMSAEDFMRQRLEDVRQLSEVKCSDLEIPPVSEESLSRLAEAVTRVELLQSKPTYELGVDLCSPQDNQQLRGALFVLYNYTRMSTLLRTFADKVREGIYPPLIPIQRVDFSLLSQQEEWILCRYLLMFPHVVQSCVDHAHTLPVYLHRICSFLSELSRVYSGYYRRVRIFTEPRDHLLPVMFARLHLLSAVEQVFRNALALMDVSPLEQM